MSHMCNSTCVTKKTMYNDNLSSFHACNNLLPPPLAHAFSTQEHPLDAGAGSEEEDGVPADVSQQEVLSQQVDHLPPRRPLRLLLLRLQRSFNHDQVAHLTGDGENQEGVERHREVTTHPVDPAKHFTGQTRHASHPSSWSRRMSPSPTAQ